MILMHWVGNVKSGMKRGKDELWTPKMKSDRDSEDRSVDFDVPFRINNIQPWKHVAFRALESGPYWIWVDWIQVFIPLGLHWQVPCWLRLCRTHAVLRGRWTCDRSSCLVAVVYIRHADVRHLLVIFAEPVTHYLCPYAAISGKESSQLLEGKQTTDKILNNR